MEEQILKKLNQLDKYIPIIDYLLDADNDKYIKLREIKHWIKSKKRYPLNTLERMEQSIITQYKNLFVEGKPPKNLIDLFNDIFVVKYVDLCSDEEKDVVEDIRIITEPNLSKSNHTVQNKSRAKATSDASENINVSIHNENRETSQRTQNIEQLCKNMEKQNELHSMGSELFENGENNLKENLDNESDTRDNDKLFKRREDFLEPNTEKKKIKKKHKMLGRVKKIKKAPTSNVCTEVISVDSSTDDENIENKSEVHCETLKTNKTPQKQNASVPHLPVPIDTSAIANAQVIENNALKAGIPTASATISVEPVFPLDQNTSSSTNLPTSIVTHSETVKSSTPNENIVPSINISDFNDYEDMSIDHLKQLYEGLKEKTGIDLECYLEDLTINLDKQSSESMINYKQTTSNDTNHFSFSDSNNTGNNILVQRPCTPYIYRNNNSIPNQPHLYSANHYHNMFYTSCNQQLPPVQKINLNDPRIIKRLREIVESPSHSRKARQTAANLRCRIPTTYGEHKRQKEAQKELDRRKVEESRLIQAEAVEKSKKSELEVNELKKQEQLKQASNIKEILLNTLQPHRHKIEDMLRKQNATKLPTEKVNCEDKLHPNRVYSGNQANNLNTTNMKSTPSAKITKTRRKSICENRTKRIVNRRKTMDVNFKIQRCESPKESSSDTDTFDFESFQLEKLKSLALKSAPIVLLHRLTESDMSKHKLNLQPLQSEVVENTLEVQLVEDTSKTMSEKLKIGSEGLATVKPKLKRPNTDSKMTEKNTVFCVLCKSRPANLTNHYLRNHKIESYVSRLTRAQLDSLTVNVRVAISVASQYKVKCVFCDEDLVNSFAKFYNHYSTHTGEYAFQCSNCGLQKPFRVDIQSHQHHSKSCRNTRIQNMYLYQEKVDVIYLHCCRICNFVQLNEANVLKHLRDHHDKKLDIPANVQKFILAKIDNAESSTTIDRSSFEAETSFELFADDGVTVSNAAIGEEEANLEGEIKPEIENLLVNISPGKYNVEEIMRKGCESSLPTISTQPPTTDVSALHSVSPSTDAISSASVTNTAISNRPIHVPMLLPPEKEDIKPDIKELKCQLSRQNEMHTNDSATHQQESLVHNCIPIQNYKTYPKEFPFFGLHKCMVGGCLFSSNIDCEMEQHLNSSSCGGQGGFLNCAYCQLDVNKFDSPKMLINHTREKHNHNRFQCPKCSYRSCVAGNVVIHYQHVHPNEEFASNLVYECEIQPAIVNIQSPERIDMLISENVQKLPCPHCSEGFYAIKSMTEHLNQVYNEVIIDISVFGRYACIYCTESSNDDAYMQKHLALNHPDEIPYVCERVLKPEIEVDAVKNLETRNVSLPVPPNLIVSVNKLQLYVDRPSSTIPNSESQNVVIASTTESSCTNESATAETKSTVLNSDTSILESVLPDGTEVKPGLEQLIEINIEALKPLLLKLTANTGLSPDMLYRCPKTDCYRYFSIFEHWVRHMVSRHQCIISLCPHCVTDESEDDEVTVELPLTDFEQHFEQHRRHLFLCFHCGETYANEDSVREHAAVAHVEINDFRMEKVPFSISHSYHLLIDSSIDIDRLKFLLELREVLVNQLRHLETMKSQRIISQWPVPSAASWLDEFPNYCPFKQHGKRCFDMGCSFHASSAEELFTHVRSNHKIVGQRFSCNRCIFKINSLTWDPILEHITMHNSNIYICCVCSYYHFDRCKLSHHIRDNHDARDVPVLNLLRSDQQTNVAIAVVYSTKRSTFSTMNDCFCCAASNLNMGTLGMHLKKAHKLTLRYFCEFCHQHLPKLQQIEDHFRSKHTLESLKIRCELASSSQITIHTVNPLRVQLKGLQARTASELPSAKRSLNSVECEDNISKQPPNKVQKTICSAVVIKQEQNADDSDDCEIIDEDDIVIAKELKAVKQQIAVGAPGTQLKCINIQNLMSTQISTPQISTPQISTPQISTPQVTTLQISTPQVSTSSPTTPVVPFVTPTRTIRCKNVRILKSRSSRGMSFDNAVIPRKQTSVFTSNAANKPLESLARQVPPEQRKNQQSNSGGFPIPVLDIQRQQIQPQLQPPLHQLQYQQNQPHLQQNYQQKQHHQYRQIQQPTQPQQRYFNVQTTFVNQSFNPPLTPNIPSVSNQYQQQEFINCASNYSPSYAVDPSLLQLSMPSTVMPQPTMFAQQKKSQVTRTVPVSHHSVTARNAMNQFRHNPH